MFRRWRVRHSYPQPVVDLVVRLMPIHGAATLSRLLDIPTSVIYRWRSKNRDRFATLENRAAEAEALATLVEQCEELGFRLNGNAPTADRRPRVLPDAAPTRESPGYASLGGGLQDSDEDATPLPRRSGSDAADDGESPSPVDAAASSLLPARSHTTMQRYVFDACKERPERGVRTRMEAVRAAIDTGYFLDVDCRTLAETAQMSLHHFIRVFHDLFGMSPHQYLTRARVDAAKRLLLASSEPIEVIAVGVGFRSGPSLSRAFKRIEGASASKYCQTLKKGRGGRNPKTTMSAVAAAGSRSME